MTNVYLVGGPRCGFAMMTTDRHPKDLWRFEVGFVIHTYDTIRLRDVDGNLWWVAKHESLSDEQAVALFLEKHYVPSRLRNS